MTSSFHRRIFSQGLAALLVLTGFAASVPAFAQQWPSKTVRIIAVFPPGGSVDQVSRILAQQLSTQTGQQFVVENRGGAAGSIGTAAIAKAEPDGYTFGVVFDTHGVNPSLIPNLSFDTLRDLQPLVLVGTGAMAITTHASQPYKNFRELLAAAKAKPGSVTYGSIGTGSLGHLAMAQIGNDLGIQWTHIPYRGGGPLMADAIAGHVPVAIGSVFLVNPHVKSGKVRVLGVTSAKPDHRCPVQSPLLIRAFPVLMPAPGGACLARQRFRSRLSNAWWKKLPRPSKHQRLLKSSLPRALTSSRADPMHWINSSAVRLSAGQKS